MTASLAAGARASRALTLFGAALVFVAAMSAPRSAPALPLPAVGTSIGKVLIATQDLSKFPTSFIASHYTVGVSFNDSLLSRVRVLNPTFFALSYINANVDPNLPAYNTYTMSETRWMHASDSACLHATTSSGRIDLFWLADRRPQLAGCAYSVYRQKAGEPAATRIAITAAGVTTYSDTGLPSGQVATYTLYARETTGIEYSYSQPQAYTASASSGQAWGPMTLAQTIATDSTTVVVTIEADPSVIQPAVLLDRNQNRSFDQSSERFNLLPAGNGTNGRLRYSATVRVATRTLSGYSFQVQDMTGSTALPLPTAGTFTTNTNNRLRDKGFGAVMSDLRDPSVTQAMVDSCASILAKGYNGLFVDAVVAFLSWFDLDGVPLGLDDASYTATELTMLQALKTAIGPNKALVYNGLSTLSMNFLTVCDGSTEEGVFMANWFANGYTPTPGWIDAINHTVQAIQVQHRAVLDLVEVHEDDIAGRIYGTASYLMCKGDFHYLALNYSNSSTVYTPELDLVMGQPMEIYLDATQYRHKSGLYGRRFEKGLVLVNPGDQTYSETLPGTMYRVDPVGGSVPALGGTGYLTYTPVTAVTLGPYAAAILLDSTVGQP